VLIRPDQKNKSVGDFVVSDNYTPQNQTTVVGTVVVPPDELFYNAFLPDKGTYKYRYERQFSMEWWTRVNVSAGDRVFFHYMAVFGDDRIEYEDCILVDFHLLYFKNPEDPIMLNGNILVDEIKHGYGRVVYAGEHNLAYLDFPIGDDPAITKGKMVYYNMGAKIEVDIFQTMNKDSSGSLRRLQRKDILAYGDSV